MKKEEIKTDVPDQEEDDAKPKYKILMVSAFENISNEWMQVLKTNDIDDILRNVLGEKSYTPHISSIFNFARNVPYNNIRIVILGQDPYPSKGDACGSAFKCIQYVPASLKNIYKCLYSQKLMDIIPQHGDLTKWENQGVLLLNAALTTVINRSNAHSGLWKDYIIKLIKQIDLDHKDLIFILWGNFARSYKKIIKSKNILEYSHPSPLSQNPFINCPNFIEANNILQSRNEPLINWNIDDIKTMKSLFGDRKEIVFTDGSCNPNNSSKLSKGTYGIRFAEGIFKNITIYGCIDNSEHNSTNIRAEGAAIIEVFKFLLQKINKWHHCIIITDSEFWINMYEKFMPRWTVEDFERKLNSDMTKLGWDLYGQIISKHVKQITFHHIYGHNKNGWKAFPLNSYEKQCYMMNKYVDALANFARTNDKCMPGDCVIIENAN
jgi:uracil-DNA glycosylase